MKNIILGGKSVDSLANTSLPMLIHGKEGSGASMYTIVLAEKWFSQGFKILFLCGYPMAEEAFGKEVGQNHPDAVFFTKDTVDDFKTAVKNGIDEKTIVIVKNIELFGNDVLTVVEELKNIIISGDLGSSRLKNELLKKKFTTEVYFSPLEGKTVPALEKYHAYLISDTFSGITSLE